MTGPSNAARVSAVRWRLRVLLCIAPFALQAQQVRREPGALPERLAPATRTAIERLADSLSAERLPADALRDKAAEGVLKGADDARILLAVRSLAALLRTSRSLLGANARDDELVAAATALFTGVTPDAIRRLGAAQRKKAVTESLATPLTIVAELATEHVPADVEVSAVESLLLRGARDADFSAFRISIERDIRQGHTPGDAVAASVHAALRILDRMR